MSWGDPKLPSETCPTIDKAISLIETVREANADLRECANFYKDKAEDLEAQVDKLQGEVESLEDQLKDALKTISDLESVPR